MELSDQRLNLAVEPQDDIRIRLDFGQLNLRAVAEGEAPYVEMPYVNDGEDPVVDIKRDGNIVEINLGFDMARSWRGWVGSFRELVWNIALPADATISAHNPVGQVRVSGFQGATMHLSTDAGQLRVENVNGNLTLRTAAGQLRGEHVGGVIDAAAEAGEVRLEIDYLDAGTHRFRTEAGAIRVILDPSIVVKIDARTSLGSVRNQVTSTPDAAAVIVASAEIGSVRIRYRDSSDDEKEHDRDRDERQRDRDERTRERDERRRAREERSERFGPKGPGEAETPYPRPAPFPRPAPYPQSGAVHPVPPTPPTPPVPPIPPVPQVPPVPPTTVVPGIPPMPPVSGFPFTHPVPLDAEIPTVPPAGEMPISAERPPVDGMPVVRRREVTISKRIDDSPETELEAILRRVEEGSLTAAEAMELLSSIDR